VQLTNRATVLAALLVVGLGLSSATADGSPAASQRHAPVTQRSSDPSARLAPRSDRQRVPRVTMLATLQHRTKGYRTARARRPSMVVPRGWYGRPSVLPVVKRNHSRLKVRLPRRPNGHKIWIARRAAFLSRTHKAIVIDLSKRHLYLFHHKRQFHAYAVGVGKPSTPTPTGFFFVAFHAAPTSAEYGSVMLESSAHSEVMRTFGGGSDAIIAIHGPIGSDAQIGHTGAAISNGCIRMHKKALKRVGRVPDGTPIIIAR
jgi:lipoprotein-anchoring transpeptidase ErfK/SrfK